MRIRFRASSQGGLPSCPAPRRVHLARPWTQASKPTLRLESSREETCQGASHGHFSTKHASPARWAAALCAFSYDTWPRKTRWMRCSSCFLGPSPLDRQLAAVWLRKGAATAFAHCGCIRSPTHRSLLVLSCVPRTAAVSGRLCSVRFLLDQRPTPFFDCNQAHPFFRSKNKISSSESDGIIISLNNHF